MFKCVDCRYEGQSFHAEVAPPYQGAFTFMAKCPQCESKKVNAIGSIKEKDLRIVAEES